MYSCNDKAKQPRFHCGGLLELARATVEKSPSARANVRLPQRCPSPPKSNGDILLLLTTGQNVARHRETSADNRQGPLCIRREAQWA